MCIPGRQGSEAQEVWADSETPMDTAQKPGQWPRDTVALSLADLGLNLSLATYLLHELQQMYLFSVNSSSQ